MGALGRADAASVWRERLRRDRLAAGGARARRRRRADRRRLLAGGIVARRRGRQRSALPSSPRCSTLPRSLLVRLIMPLASAPWFPLAACGHQPATSRQPDARHPAGGRTRQLLRARRPRAAEQPDRRIRRRHGPRWCRHVHHRRPARSGRGRRSAAPRARRIAGAAPARLVPVLRARVTAVRRTRGEPRELQRRARPRFARARVHDHLSRSPRIQRAHRPGHVLEAWRRRGTAPRPKYPSRKAFTSASTFSVGDEMRFDVLGRQVLARVTSIRHVEWGDARSGGFMFVFRPGAFAGAPHTYIGFVKGPDDPTRPRAASVRSRRTISEHHGHRRTRDHRAHPEGDRQRGAGHFGRRRYRAPERGAHPHRRRRDDQVPARLRIGNPPDAWRQHAAC